MNGISKLIAGDAAAGAASIEEALALADDLEILEQVQQAGGGAIFVGDWGRARSAVSTARSSWPAIAARPRCFSRPWACARSSPCGSAGWPTLPPTRTRPCDSPTTSAPGTLALCRSRWAGAHAELKGAGRPEAPTRCWRWRSSAGSRSQAGLATWALAQLDLAAGRWNEALLRLTAIEEVRPGFGHPFLPVLSSWDRVEAAVLAGHPDVAERALARFAPWAAVAAAPWAAPVLADCRALAAPGRRGRCALRGRDRLRRPRGAARPRADPPALRRVPAPRAPPDRRPPPSARRQSRASSRWARPRGPSAPCASCAPPARRPASATSARWPSSRRRSCRSPGSSATARPTRRSHRSSS